MAEDGASGIEPMQKSLQERNIQNAGPDRFLENDRGPFFGSKQGRGELICFSRSMIVNFTYVFALFLCKIGQYDPRAN